MRDLADAVQTDDGLKSIYGDTVNRYLFDCENRLVYERLRNMPQYKLVMDIEF
jgi:hypothetical protein